MPAVLDGSVVVGLLSQEPAGSHSSTASETTVAPVVVVRTSVAWPSFAPSCTDCAVTLNGMSSGVPGGVGVLSGLVGLPAGLCHELMTAPVGGSAARAAGARTSSAAAAQIANPIDPNR